jgi:hypothetical protein
MIEAEVYSSRCKLHVTERNEDNNIKKKKKKEQKGKFTYIINISN